LVALHEILPTFQKENKLQKVQCVILTDGEAHSLKYHREFNRPFEKEPYLGLNTFGSNAFLRDRKTGNTYSFKSDFTDVLLRNLRDKFPSINFIGMRILESREVGYFVRGYTGWVSFEYDKIMNSWKKEKSFSIKSSGYHTYFGLSASALANETEFEVANDATKSQIKSAFVNSLKSKKMNKKVLGEFISLVA
jgi:ribosomal protein L23